MAGLKQSKKYFFNFRMYLSDDARLEFLFINKFINELS